jgi:hypothetical protein
MLSVIYVALTGRRLYQFGTEVLFLDCHLPPCQSMGILWRERCQQEHDEGSKACPHSLQGFLPLTLWSSHSRTEELGERNYYGAENDAAFYPQAASREGIGLLSIYVRPVAPGSLRPKERLSARRWTLNGGAPHPAC